MKKCPKCQRLKRLNGFTKDKNTKDGHNVYCRLCTRSRNLKHFWDNRKKYLEQEKKRYIENQEKVLARQRKYRQDNHERHLAVRRAYYRKNILKLKEYAKIKHAVKMAVKRGVITKEPCKMCGDTKVEAHHYMGYEKENWLNVMWLCSTHHHRKYYGTEYG